MNKYLWSPSEKQIKNSRLSDFSNFVGFKSDKDFKQLWKWSVSNSELFWSKFWDYSKIIGTKGKEIIRKDKVFNKTKFFPDSRINYSENILKKKIMKLLLVFYLKQGLRKEFHGTNYTKKCVNFLIT